MKAAYNPFLHHGTSYKKAALQHTPTQKRRELISLFGACLIFFVGLTGHSASIDSTQHMVKSLVRLMLVFLGLAAPAAKGTDIQMANQPKAPVVSKVRAGVPNSMQLSNVNNLKKYLYRFEGKASHEGVACPQASVLVRILSGSQTITTGGITNDDGTYSIEVPVLAVDGAPVDWHMEAFTSEFKKLELSGRRIVQEEEERLQSPIVVTTPVEFVISSSK